MNMDQTEKVVNFANFNVTYGSEEKPMLTYFENVIFPAFSNKMRREVHNGYYYFDDIQIREIGNECVLVGNLIKVTEYNVRTVVKNEVLCTAPSTIPTAPYSRFMVFLCNHRMTLVKNESNSPSLNSFQAHCKYVISDYIKEKNQTLNKQDRFPSAKINVLNLPLKSSVSEAIESLIKISSVKFNFFPLNNDIPTDELFKAVYQQKDRLGCKTSNLVFNSPKSKDELTEMIINGAPITRVTVKGKDSQGNPHTVKENNFSSNRKVTIIGDISPESDEKKFEKR